MKRSRCIDRETAINVALVVVSILVVFATLEAALQFGLVGGSSPPGIDHEFCGNTTDRFAVRTPAYRTLAPEAAYRTKYPKDDWELVTANDNGFRDTFDSGSDQILVFGDSFTFGAQASNEETFPYLLDHSTPETQFENYGLPGYGPHNALALYRYLPQNQNTTAVVYGYYLGNDAIDPGQRPPYYGVEGDTLNRTEESSVRLQEPPEGPLVGVDSFLGDNTATYSFLAPRGERALAKLGLIRPAKYMPPTGEDRTRSLRLTREILRTLAEETARNDTDLIVAIIPERGAVNTSNPNRLLTEEWGGYHESQRRMLLGIAANHSNVRMVDMKASLRSKVEAGKRVYGTHNAHLDDYGYGTVARTLLDRMEYWGYVENATPVLFDEAEATRDTPCP